MKKALLFLFAAVWPWLMQAQVVYEDFEGGTADLTWQAGNGTYDGVIANPDPAGLNTSAFVGSYTKSNQHAYSLFSAELATNLDLSVNNQFKIQIYAGEATQVLLKLEGPGGAVEQTKNITLADVWMEYTFDFSSAAGNTGLNKIILFFDPGVTASGDTYLFDNLSAGPAGPCAGVAANPDFIDDFECQRNASYGVGFDRLTAIANPDPSGINTSATVGRYEDPLDEWSALVIDYNDAMDFSVRTTIRAKIWSPKTGQVLFKLEGGASPPAEVFIPVTQTNTWVEYTADFSAQAGANHKRIAIFFNAGVLAVAGDVYFIDDIQRIPPPPAPPLETFEPVSLTWAPLNNNTALHGTFSVINNPSSGGINTTTKVGSYTKGSSSFSTLTALLPSGFSLADKPQINLQVLAPAGSTSLRMQLSSPTAGNKDVTRDITTPGAWEELSFDYSDFIGVTDFIQMNLFFDPGFSGSGAYLLDNLSQTGSTVDPCEGVTPLPNYLDDFECQRNVAYGAGADRLSVVPNPDVSNANNSLKVGKYADPTDEWSALVLDFGAPIDLSVYNQFFIKIRSPKAVPLLFKLEGGTSNAREVTAAITQINSWQSYLIDFSAFAGENHRKLAIFFNQGVVPPAGDEYLIDDLRWRRAAYSGCINDYETAASSITNFKYFANGYLETQNYAFKVVDNPTPNGVNPSTKVGEFKRALDALTFAGMYADLDAPIKFDGAKTVRAKVLMDHIGNFAVKLEGSTTGAQAIEIPVPNTKVNEWEELTFDFSAVGSNANYQRLTVFFDLGINATGVDVTSYFDEIVIGNGACLTTRIDPDQLEAWTLAPNPAASELRVTFGETGSVRRLVVQNLMGQPVLVRDGVLASEAVLDVRSLPAGIYVLSGYRADGSLAARSKFRKD